MEKGYYESGKSLTFQLDTLLSQSTIKMEKGYYGMYAHIMGDFPKCRNPQ